MKRIVMGALAVLLFAGAVQAQDTTRSRQHHKQGMEQLNLSAEQKAKIEALRAEQKEAFAKLKSNADADATRQQRKELHQKYKAQMEAILTAEQKQKMAAIRAQHSKTAKGQTGERRMAIKEQLALTGAQQEQMKSLNQSFKAKRETLRKDAAISEAQKREQMQALAQQHREEIKKILTPEQAQKMDALRKEHRKGSGK